MTDRVRGRLGSLLALLVACNAVFLAGPTSGVPVMGVQSNSSCLSRHLTWRHCAVCSARLCCHPV